MKKIICPKCGEVEHYGLLEKCHQVLIFNADDKPCGGTELVCDWSSTVQRCLHCNRKVKIYNVIE